jgi:ribosomal protein S18 acetylase RimI-like enzyme
MKLSVREARSEAEWQAGCAVLYDAYVGGGFTANDLAQRMMKRENLEPGGIFLVAMLADEVIGAVLFLHEGSALTQIAQPGEREFRVLGVSPNTRGTGAGEALVKACVEQARSQGAQALVLWTQPTMHAAQKLYAKLGFVRDPSRDVADPRGFTRMVYVLSLGA